MEKEERRKNRFDSNYLKNYKKQTNKKPHDINI